MDELTRRELYLAAGKLGPRHSSLLVSRMTIKQPYFHRGITIKLPPANEGLGIEYGGHTDLSFSSSYKKSFVSHTERFPMNLCLSVILLF